jgi:hypothetical protein
MPEDDLKSPREKFDEAFVRSGDLGNFRRGITIATIAGFGLAMAFFVVAGPFGYGDDTFLLYSLLSVAIGIAIGFLYSRIAAKAYGFVPRHKPARAPVAPGSTVTAPVVSTRALPRLAGMRTVSDDEVLGASLDEILNSAASRGGLADRTTEPSVGVFVPTVTGLAFLPDVESLTVKTLRQSQPLIWGFAKELIPGTELLELAEIVHSEDNPESRVDLPSWLAKSRTRKDHFVIAWPDLVEVKVDPANYRTTLVREGPDGKRSSYMLEADEPALADALIRRRVHFEVSDLFLDLVVNPRLAELRPKVSAEFEKIYGDRLKDHTDEVEKELWVRALAGVKASDFVSVLASRHPETMGDAYMAYLLPAMEWLGTQVGSD